MFELISAWLLSLWPASSSDLQELRSARLATWIGQSQVEELIQPKYRPDPVAVGLVEQYLAGLNIQGVRPADQGIWFQSGREVLAKNQGTTPLPAASLTKIATTLVALNYWGGDHQFVTTIGMTGPIQDGVLKGDLVIQGGGDPLFIWEEAIALGNALEQAGITAIEGDLLIAGDFAMNYEADPLIAGTLLRRALHSDLWPEEAREQHAEMPPNTPYPQILIDGFVQPISRNELAALTVAPLLEHQSLPLAQILKLMNIYSNNFMADALAEAMGGGTYVSMQAARLANVPPEEVQLVNGSGLGVENRLSARAVCAMLTALHAQLATTGLTVADLFPIAGLDTGTLEGRALPRDAAVKTGTLADVSALAGVFATGDRDLVWFAIINRGLDLDGLRDQQDALLQSLTQVWSVAQTRPLELTPRQSAIAVYDQLGAPDRNRLMVSF
ncbi:MAG: D-alanyl-D-alanine carboxypeptidase [Synechococcales bacterium]|nr:D-alanyl-D-alanine carboxypeptidase [Synechococcales bacterium]